MRGGFDQNGYDKCIGYCDTIYPLSNNEDVEHATLNGWYITIEPPFQGNPPIYKIKNNSVEKIEISRDIDHPSSFQDYLDVLEKLPDPRKTYITTGIFGRNKKNWKLIYNADTRLFQWENQIDKNTKQRFIIETPLKIGDKTAKQLT